MIRSKRAEEARPKVEPPNEDSDWEGIYEAMNDLDDVLRRTTRQVDVDDIFDSWSPSTYASNGTNWILQQPVHLYPKGHEFWQYAELELLSMRSKLKCLGISPSILDADLRDSCYDLLDALNDMRDQYTELYGPYHEDE